MLTSCSAIIRRFIWLATSGTFAVRRPYLLPREGNEWRPADGDRRIRSTIPHGHENRRQGPALWRNLDLRYFPHPRGMPFEHHGARRDLQSDVPLRLSFSHGLPPNAGFLSPECQPQIQGEYGSAGRGGSDSMNPEELCRDLT